MIELLHEYIRWTNSGTEFMLPTCRAILLLNGYDALPDVVMFTLLISSLWHQPLGFRRFLWKDRPFAVVRVINRQIHTTSRE